METSVLHGERNESGQKIDKTIRKAAAPTSHLKAHSRNRTVHRKPSLKKNGSCKITLFFTNGYFFLLAGAF